MRASASAMLDTTGRLPPQMCAHYVHKTIGVQGRIPNHRIVQPMRVQTMGRNWQAIVRAMLATTGRLHVPRARAGTTVRHFLLPK